MADVGEGSQKHPCSHDVLGDSQVQAPLVGPNYPLTSQERGFSEERWKSSVLRFCSY